MYGGYQIQCYECFGKEIFDVGFFWIFCCIGWVVDVSEVVYCLCDDVEGGLVDVRVFVCVWIVEVVDGGVDDFWVVFVDFVVVDIEVVYDVSVYVFGYCIGLFVQCQKEFMIGFFFEVERQVVFVVVDVGEVVIEVVVFFVVCGCYVVFGEWWFWL